MVDRGGRRGSESGSVRAFATPAERREDRIILHVDMDCFYAACERLREPELTGEPVVIGMGYEDDETHGAVATASYEARAFGVESAQAISTALERLPRKSVAEADPELDPTAAAYYRPVDMDFYKSISEDVMDILHECADTVREVSVDEAYLDVTDRTAWEVAEGFARHVKDRIRREVGVTASVGVAPNMSAAKIASDFEKPDGLVVVRPDELRGFLAPLPVEAVHGVGPVTARELADLGIETAGDLAAVDPRELIERFGERGRELGDRARGEDDRAVTPTGRPKSLSRESAFTEPVTDETVKRERVEKLAASVSDRARRKGAMYRTVGIKAVTPPFEIHTRERSLPGPVDDPDLVSELALSLLGEFEGDRVRKLGVRVSNLTFASTDQARLDGWDVAPEREANAEQSDETGASPGDRTAAAVDETDENGPVRDGQASLTDF